MKTAYMLIGFTILGVLLWGLWLARKFWSRPTDWANFMIAAWSAAFATMIFGFVVGYGIYYIQSSNENATREAQEARQSLDNRTRILSFLKTELTYNRDTLRARGSDSNQALARIQDTPLKNEFWKIVSGSGDLRWIGDYSLLYKIADAYFYLAQTMYWEHQMLEATTSVGIAMTVNRPDGTSVSLARHLWSIASPTYLRTQEALTAALSAIE
jgi:hypothetical protein